METNYLEFDTWKLNKICLGVGKEHDYTTTEHLPAGSLFSILYIVSVHTWLVVDK